MPQAGLSEPLRLEPSDVSDKPALVTIHGINSNGTWQSDLQPVFSPHFRYRAIRYGHYRILGATKILLEPWIVPVAVIGLAAAYAAGVRFDATAVAAGLVATVVLGYLAAAVRRRLAFVAVLRQFDDHVKLGERSYVVAHSFGTCLCGHLLQRPTTRCSRLIFAGSVLSREFLSKRLPQRGEMPFEELRNEIGPGDPVVRLAGFVRRLVRDLGTAGLDGFVGDSSHVHEIDRPDQQCSPCDTADTHPSWLVHNVTIPDYAHSDQFITPKHALQFWLPFLWGTEIPEFRDWLEWCRVASYAGHGGLLSLAGLAAEKRLLGRHWSWANSTIGGFISSEYPSAVALIDNPISAVRVYRALWGAVVRACDHAVAHEEDPKRMAYARALDPREAVRMAVGVVNP